MIYRKDCHVPRNWQNRWLALRRAAGFTHWVPDVCRHTFASYHAAHFRNLPELQLFQKVKSTINEHIKNIYDDGELVEASTMRKFRIFY